MFLHHQIDIAIKRLKEFEPDEGYHLAFSGGKDSIVIKQLAIEAGVKFDAHYNNTTIDPPELIKFIRIYHEDINWHNPKIPFLKRMPIRGFPRRQARWCCWEYKEQGGRNRLVVTGIRWAESSNRSKRRMTEQCYRETNRTFLHPIIDWSNEDVWAFIRDRGLNYCSLYDEGYDRVGCIFCPMAYYKRRLTEAERYPKYVRAFIKSFEKLYQRRVERGNKEVINRWKSGEDMFWWWIGQPPSSKDVEDENQVLMFSN